MGQFSMFVCEYCNNTFARSTVLRKHQKTAKYCLSLQGKASKEIIYKCEHCDHVTNRADNLKRHRLVCPGNSDVEQPSGDPKLLEMIVELQKTIINMGNGTNGTTINNTRSMNLAPITNEEIREHLDSLSLDFIFDGAKGYAVYADFYPFKDRVICTDKSRKKLRYRDGDSNEMVSDFGGVKLAQRFFQVIAPRNEELINAEYSNLQKQVEQIVIDGTAGTTDLTGILMKSTKLQDLLAKCRQAARGEENSFTREFINHFSRML